MAAVAVNRAAERVVLGGGMPAPRGAAALEGPAGGAFFGGACRRCVVSKEAWPPPASNEERCLLHQRLSSISASAPQSFASSGRRDRRAIRLSGSGVRSLAEGPPEGPEVVLR